MKKIFLPTKHIIALLVILGMCIAAVHCVNADGTNNLKLDGTLINVVHAPDGSWLHAGEKVHIYSIDDKVNTAQISYKGTNITIPKYGLNQQDVAFFQKYNYDRPDKVKLPPNAPIIESGRLVETITNTSVNLTESYRIPLIKQTKVNDDYSMEGEWVGTTAINPGEPAVKINVIKVDDDIATILVQASNRPPMPAVQVPYDVILELKGMPHLTDSNSNWFNSEKVMESLQGAKAHYLAGYTPPITSLSEIRTNTAYKPGRAQNDKHTLWNKSPVVDEYQKLQVPITTEANYGDNSALVAVANALSYLYTKAESNPTQVSKSYLAWAHDAYPLTDSAPSNDWHPDDFVIPTKIDEGQRVEHQQLTGSDVKPSGNKESKPHFLHPEIILVPVTSGDEHRVDLGRLLKGIERLGVAFENEQPSGEKWVLPAADIQAVAKGRITSKPLVVRCFNAWNENNLLRRYEDVGQMIQEEEIYNALYHAFVTKEVAAGHPVIVTYLKETSPKSRIYTKRSYLITGSGNPQHPKSLQFLTPSGKFESYDYLGASQGGEVLPIGDGNPFGNLRYGAPCGRSYVGWNPKLIWKNITYARSDYEPSATSSSYGADHRFEVYSLGFE